MFVATASLIALASQEDLQLVVVVDSFRTSRKRSQLEAALSLSSVTAPIVVFLGECSFRTWPVTKDNKNVLKIIYQSEKILSYFL